MKKVLFASSALVAAGLIGAGSAQAADPIKIELGGFSKWWVVGASQSSGSIGATGGANTINGAAVKGDNEIHFKGSTQLDNGLKVGVFVALEAGGHSDLTTDTIDSSYAWVEGGFGKLMVGTLNNAAALTHVSAPDAAGNFGVGGMAVGNYTVARPSVVMGANQRGQTTASTNGTQIVTDNKSEKLVYVTPSFAGLSVGVSYTGNITREDNRGVNQADRGAYAVGVGYTRSIGPVGLKLSAGLMQSYLAQGEILTQQSYGTQLSYAGFTLGGSYQRSMDDLNGRNGQTAAVNGYYTLFNAVPGSLVARGDNRYDFGGSAYDVGLQYATGPYAISFAYFNSETVGATNYNLYNGGKDTVEFYQASGKYTLSPGVDLLASVGFANYESKYHNRGIAATSTVSASDNNDALANSGYYGMTGLSLKF